jgi:site-specific recombinase XerD
MRHHRHESVQQRTIKEATRKLALIQLANRHTLGHSFATQFLEDGYDILPIQERRGHRDVKTTMMYTHVLNRGAQGVYSPMNRL